MNLTLSAAAAASEGEEEGATGQRRRGSESAGALRKCALRRCRQSMLQKQSSELRFVRWQMEREMWARYASGLCVGMHKVMFSGPNISTAS